MSIEKQTLESNEKKFTALQFFFTNIHLDKSLHSWEIFERKTGIVEIEKLAYWKCKMMDKISKQPYDAYNLVF